MSPSVESASGSASRTAPAERTSVPERPHRIGRFVIREHLGEGGMGVVWLAHDPVLDREVAVKLLRARGSEGDRTTRLLREAQALARLTHPNVIRVFDVGMHQGRVFMAMEYVPGQTLGQWLRTEPGQDQIVDAFVQAGRGLEAAHEAGLVHRDFKPANVLIGADGRIRVVDFGLAAPPRGEAEATLRSGDWSVLDLRMTATGLAVGTPAYMSPEAHAGGLIDAKSDQWSFCASLYEALYGQRPFDGADARELAQRVHDGMPDVLGDGRVPVRLRLLVRRGLAVDPVKRWPTMTALLERLQPARRLGPWWWALGSLVTMIGVIAVVHGVVGDAAEEASCDRVDAAVTEIWGDAARASVRDAFTSSGVSYAEDTWQRVSESLDAQARGLARARREACEASRAASSTEELALEDRRAVCLRRSLVELRELVVVLEQADAPAVRHAITAVGELRSPRGCDEEARHGDAPPPPPAALEAEVEAVHEIIARARATSRAGHYARARELASEAFARAQSLPYAPIVAEVRAELGRACETDGEYQEAERHLIEASALARAEGLDALAAAVSTDLAYVVGQAQRRPEDGQRWVRHASAAIERLADPADARIRLERTQGVLGQVTGDYEASRQHLERALAQAEERRGPRHPQTLRLRSDLGLAHYHLGEHARAKTIFERVLAMRTDVYGAGHPEVSSTVGNLAIVEQALGELEASAEHSREALAALELSVGREHPLYPQLLTNLANTESLRGRLDEALALHEEAKGLLVASVGPRAFIVGRATMNIGVLHHQAQRVEPAQQAFVQALEIFDEHLRPDHPERAILLTNLAHVERDLGRVDESLAGFEQAIAVLEAELGPEHPELTYALAGRGHTHLEAGHEDEALADFRRALAVAETAGMGAGDVALMRYHLAGALWELGRLEDGRRMMEQIRVDVRELHADTPVAVEVEDWLAKHPEPR